MSALEECGDRTDLAERWGISRQRVAQLTAAEGFPEPAGMIGDRPVWRLAECDEWRASRRRPGRPRSSEQ